MLPRNFPERKNQRRKAALERLERAEKQRPNKSFGLEIAIKNTKAKIVDNALGVKSKKPRSKK